MLTPVLHLNGSSAESLVTYYRQSIMALRAALEALGYAAPNARDFYILGSDAYYQAQNEHRAREQAVAKVLADMTAMRDAVLEQVDARGRQSAGL